MVASTAGEQEAGNDQYQQAHMGLIFKQGLSFSGYERDHLYLNLDGEKYKDISAVSGIDSLSDGRSAVLADFDNDGDMDVFLTTIQGEGQLLFRNNVGQDNQSIRVALEGNGSGKDAFGAIVRAKTSRGIQAQVKSGGGGFLAQHDARLLFGLGKDSGVEWLEVSWPSGKVQRLGPLAAGESVKVLEGVDQYQKLKDRRARLPEPLSREETFWRKTRLTKGKPLAPLPVRSLSGDARTQTFSPEPGVSYLLNFWATWCAPCRQEMPELQKLSPEFEARGIRLIGISLDQEVGPSEVQSFADSLGVKYPLLMLQPDGIERIFSPEQVFVPLSLLVDQTGRVAQIYPGWSAETERRIKQLLADNPPSGSN